MCEHPLGFDWKVGSRGIPGNSIQTAAAKSAQASPTATEIRNTRRPRRHEGFKMSEADQFRQYAEEAKRWVRQSKTEKEKQVLIELARTWTQAAAESERSIAVNYRAM